MPLKFASAVNGTAVFRLGMSEIEYLVAVRQQLGFGLDGLMGRPSESETGEVCRACKKGTIVEPRRDQHIQASCLSGQGQRSMAHNRIIKVVTDLTGWAVLNYVNKGSGAWRTTASSRLSPT